MSTPRRLVASTSLALLLAVALSGPARAVYLESPDEQGSSMSEIFEGFFGFLSSIFAANNGNVVP